jgi:AmmeMemoRadiSam system protein A
MKPAMTFRLSDEEKRSLLELARGTIAARLKCGEPPRIEPGAVLSEPCGAFVTLHKQQQLRGCIGYVRGIKPLIDTVSEVAAASAFEDPRFPQVSAAELPDLEIEISVLSPLRLITDVKEIEVGVHGIMLTQGFRSGLLLPQVAEEYGWDRETFLAHTCRKAGLPGDCWKQRGTEIEIFSALIFSESKLGR